jgi:hypothetical protein
LIHILIAKEKSDAIRRPKTGGGPKHPSPPEMEVLHNMEYMPIMSGLTSGHDTENGMYNSIKVCTLYIVLSVRIGWFVVIVIAWGKQ